MVTFIKTEDGYERVRLSFDYDDDVLVQLIDDPKVRCWWSPRRGLSGYWRGYDVESAGELARDCALFWVEQRCR